MKNIFKLVYLQIGILSLHASPPLQVVPAEKQSYLYLDKVITIVTNAIIDTHQPIDNCAISVYKNANQTLLEIRCLSKDTWASYWFEIDGCGAMKRKLPKYDVFQSGELFVISGEEFKRVLSTYAVGTLQ